MSSTGHKVTNDPEATRNPKQEPTGIVAPGSLAAESIDQHGGFAENPKGSTNQLPSTRSSTGASSSSTTGATAKSDSPGATTTTSGSTSQQSSAQKDSQPPNASFEMTPDQIGTDKDPSRLAEHKFDQINSGGSLAEAGIPKRTQAADPNVYDVLGESNLDKNPTSNQSQNKSSSGGGYESSSTSTQQEYKSSHGSSVDTSQQASKSSSSNQDVSKSSSSNQSAFNSSGNQHSQTAVIGHPEVNKQAGLPPSGMLKAPTEGAPPAVVDAHKANLELPEQPPAASDWQSFDERNVNLTK